MNADQKRKKFLSKVFKDENYKIDEKRSKIFRELRNDVIDDIIDEIKFYNMKWTKDWYGPRGELNGK